MYRNKGWKDRRGNEVEWEVGDLIDEWAVEKGRMCQLYTQPAPDSGSVYHDPVWPCLACVSVCCSLVLGLYVDI